MLIKRLGSWALAAATALVPLSLAQNNDDKNPQSVFITPDRALMFAFSVPENDNEDFYFMLRVQRRYAWGAVGLGSDDMPGALFFMVYDNRNGQNVTFSPRLAYGHYEPYYYPQLEYTFLEHTGISKDEYMVVQARCTNHCRSWPGKNTPGGKVDVYSSTEKAVWALGPEEWFASDYATEGIKYHERYGSFEIDMGRTRNAKEPAFIDGDSVNVGTKSISSHDGKSDIRSTLHAVFMILAIVGLMPLGVVILRLGGAARWHGLNQSAAMLFVLVGFAMGVWTSFRYQRSMRFDSYHQVLGMLLTVFFLVQFGIGFMNHQQYRRTQVPSKNNVYHIWLGRVLILLAIMNGFFGFTFALNRRYGMVLAGLIITVCFLSLFFLIGRQYMNKRQGVDGIPFGAPRSPYDNPANSGSARPTRPSWRDSRPLGDPPSFPAEPPPRYESTQEDSQHNIGLRPVSPWRRDEPSVEPNQRSQTPGLGNVQTPRELI